jgi:hypothetical protein
MGEITPALVRRLLTAAKRKQTESRLLALLGSAVDHASDLGDEEGLELAAAAIEAAHARNVAAPAAATLHYFHANAWASLRHLRHKDMAAVWTWESAEQEQEILSLRCALAHPPDPLAYRTTEDDLLAKTLRLLKMARSTLIYLSLAVHREERGKAQPETDKVHRSALRPMR